MLAAHRLTPILSTSPTEVSEFSLPPSQTSSPPTSIPSSHLFDLVIIGSGPASLALVARILSVRPASLYTEDEHRHLHWLKKSGNDGSSGGGGSRTSKLKTVRTGRGEEKVLKRQESEIQGECQCEGKMRILVIDKIGGWLAAWDRAFKEYDIKYLRSPLFFHPSPDLDALLAYSSRTGRDSQACPTTLLSILSRNSLAPCEPCRGRTARKQASSRFRETGNSNPDLAEIANVVGKEVSKHKKKKYGRSSIGVGINERDRQDYFTPSTKLFRDFIDEDVIKRHGLDADSKWKPVQEGLVEASGQESDSKAVTTVKGEVSSLSYGELHVEGWEILPGFCVETSSGIKIGAKSCVIAVGPGGKPAVPEVFSSSKPSKRNVNSSSTIPSTPGKGQGWCHASTLTSPDYQFPSLQLQDQIKSGQSKTICVLGGGLTSAQICDLSLRKGFSKVILVMRDHMKVKPFDVGLEWMGRYSNLEKMRFWQEDRPEIRLEMLKSARQGGSITPPYSKLLASHEASGRLEILTNTEISSAKWNQEVGEWDLTFKRTLPTCSGGSKNRKNSKNWTSNPISPSSSTSSTENGGVKEGERVEEIERKVNFCVTATGAKLDFINLPFMKEIKENHPLRVEGGLPVLTEDLQWGKDLPLFMVGVASAMQIGPSAGNLGGMREAADRVARRLEELSVGGTSSDYQDLANGSEEEVKRLENGSLSDDDDDEDGIRDYPTAFTHFNFEALNTVEVE